MSKLDPDVIEKIQTQMEVAARYQHIRPLEQHLALIAMRLFMYRFGYDQVISNLKNHGAERMATAAQHELKQMANTWIHALNVEPPPAEQEPMVRRDVALVDNGSRSKDINERLYKIMARLQIREDMIQQRRADPPRTVQ